MIVRLLAEGFVLGISSGAVCIGSCAPFLVPYLMVDSKRRFKENSFLLWEFLLGRFVAYVIFGMFAGWFGSELRPFLSEAVRSGILTAAALLMIIFALSQAFHKNPFCALILGSPALQRFPFLLGFLLGINICPPFLAGFARIIEIANPWLGAVFFVSFFLATTLYFIPLFAVAPIFSSDRTRQLGMMASLLVGVWYLAMGLTSLF